MKRGDELPRLIAWLATLPPEAQERIVARLPDAMTRTLNEEWRAWALKGQAQPVGDWRVWLIQAGRGYGKTRAGAEWVSGFVRATPDARVALVGATIDDAVRVMLKGPSGVLTVARDDEWPAWRAQTGEVRWPNGAVATVYSAEVPEKLRGPEHHIAWCDELAKWRNGDATWDNLRLSMRLGAQPRVLVTTTPRTNALMRRVRALAEKDEAFGRGRTGDNPYLPEAYVAAMEETYGGTLLGRQELDGELIAEVAGALWSRALASAVAAVRVYLRIEGAAEQAVLEQAAASAIAIGEAFTGALFLRRAVEERVPAASGWAALAAQPVAAIEAVLAADGSALPVEAYAVDIDTGGCGWLRLTGGSATVTVRYSAGLAASWDALDAPLAQGVVLLAAHLFDRRDAGAQPPAAVAALWRPYRRLRLAWLAPGLLGEQAA